MNDPTYLGKKIRSDEYVRQRMSPKPGDGTYLHLADLRLAMEHLRTDAPIHLLDYGCGGSPYRSLFLNANYKRADFLQMEGDTLDYILNTNSHVNEKDETFDFILSTQVLEHVDNPQAYIEECHRLLKKGGHLYITTHGSYPDHGCPYDYYRWTTDGLARTLRTSGFTICRVEKQTTGPRAFFFQYSCLSETLTATRKTIFGILLHISKMVYRKLQPWIDRMCDKHFEKNRVVTEQLEMHSSYIVTACLAKKE